MSRGVPSFTWMGSKRRLARRLLPLFPEHTCYVEAFAGSAALLLTRDEPAHVEVLNDVDGEIVNFFRVAKHHLTEFCVQFRYALVSRQLFEWEKETPPETLTDIQRAARFYYLQKLAFGARPTGRTFGTSAMQPPRLNLTRLEEDLTALHLRLAHVLVEKLDWQECLRRYDRPDTFFYLDPPYHDVERGYGTPFTLDDYQALADRLATLEGKALLSLNDHPDMRRIFAPFHLTDLPTTYKVGGKDKPARELVIRNWS